MMLEPRGSNARACWSGWMESPPAWRLEMSLHVHASPARVPLTSSIAPRYTVSSRSGGIDTYQSYAAWSTLSTLSDQVGILKDGSAGTPKDGKATGVKGWSAAERCHRRACPWVAAKTNACPGSDGTCAT